MKIQNLIEYIYFILIVSIFLKIKIYPFVMIAFILCVIVKSIKKYNLTRENIYLHLFLISVIINFFIFTNQNRNMFFFIKLLINISFLIAFEINIKYFIVKKNIKKILLIIKFLIIMTFLQIVLLYYLKEINIFQFLKIGSSNDAYIINLNEIIFLFGNSNKNIWATKIFLLEIILLVYLYKNNKKSYLFKILIFLNCILLISRTCYLAYILYYCSEIFNKVLKKFKNNKKILILILLFLSLFFIPIINLVAEKLLRLNFTNIEELLTKKGDGGGTRLINWLIFFRYFNEINIFKGIGLGNTQSFLVKYNGFPDNNMHNFIFGIFLEQGIIIGTIYLLFHYSFIKKVILNFRFESLMILLPFYLIISLQYLGYDNDIVVYISLVHILLKYFLESKKNKQKEYL